MVIFLFRCTLRFLGKKYNSIPIAITEAWERVRKREHLQPRIHLEILT